MAIVFTVLSMLLTCGRDLFEKKSVSNSTEDVLKTLVWYGIFNAVLFCLILAFGLDETALPPHELILTKPVIVLSPILNFTCLFFAIFAYKYVGVSVRNTFVNTDGFFFVVLLVLYHVTTGNAQYSARLFVPRTMIGLILIVSAAIIYPNIKPNHDEEKSSEQDLKKTDKSKWIVALGVIIAIIAGFFDGAESMVSSVLIGDDIVDSMEYMCALALIQVIITTIVWIGISIKNRKIYNPFSLTEKNRFIGQLFGIVSDMFYIFALSSDALLGIILWNVFPILDMIGARIFLKEKLTFIQYLVLIMMVVGAVCVSLS